MSSVECLREFVSETITAAAEEISTEFIKTIVQYEEQIDRQRRLLGITSKPQTASHTIAGDAVENNYTTTTSHRGPTSEQLLSSLSPVSENQDQNGSSFMLVQCKVNSEEILGTQNISKRLTAAVEEVFSVFVKTVVQYKEEINHQSRLLDIISKPQIKLHRIDLQQQHVYKEEEEVLTDQQLSDQKRSSSLDQAEPEPPQMKEEQEETEPPQMKEEQEETEPPQMKEEQDELCISQEEEQLGLKQETDTFMVTPSKEESDHSEPEPNWEQFLSPISPVSESQDQEGSEDSGSHSNCAENITMSESQCETATGKKAAKCDICGKRFELKSRLKRHLRIHTREKPYCCKICGKNVFNSSNFIVHMRIHTGEKPYSCKTCGKNFVNSSNLSVHRRTHTGEKPYACKTCGKNFTSSSHLTVHIRTHTGEKPYFCKTCGKNFSSSSNFTIHMRTHTGEKPYPCKTCGKTFISAGGLIDHTRTHTGERPYFCATCGKNFTQSRSLTVHMRTHTGEKPYFCKTCGKNFTRSDGLTVHMRTHTGEKPYFC